MYILADGKLKKPQGQLYPEGAKYSSPGAGVHSTASDMGVFYQMMRNGGTSEGKRILSRSSVDMMTAIHTGTLDSFMPGTGWGLGWIVVREPLGTLSLSSIGTYGHSAYSGSYGWVDAKKDLVGVFLVSGPRGHWEARDVFMAMASAAVD